ncbi:unnamed protein product, partial [Meganyctiphanes norvegica]
MANGKVLTAVICNKCIVVLYKVVAITFLCKAGHSNSEITDLTGVSKCCAQRWTKKFKDSPDADLTLQKKPPGIPDIGSLIATPLPPLDSSKEVFSPTSLAKEFASEKNLDFVEELERIQCILQDIGSLIATPLPPLDSSKESEERNKRLHNRLSFNPRHVAQLEQWIDGYTDTLPPLSNFILPGGGHVSASLHVARSVCRRAERSVVPLVAKGCVDNQVLVYINRLSDYLFTVSRVASMRTGKKETIYFRPKPKGRLRESQGQHLDSNVSAADTQNIIKKK